MRLTGKCFAGVLCILLLASVGVRPSMAQSTTDGAISGTVYDSSGAVVPKAKVTARNNGTNLEQSVTTDDSGYFRVLKLQPASYTVKVEVAGFANFEATQVVVQVGATTEINPHLNVSSAGATVLVTEETAQINTTDPGFGPLVDQTEIQNLPINGGRWSDFSLLTPGVVNDSNGFGLLSFRGMSTLLNNNTIDGADNNQAFFSEERGRTRAGYSSAKAAVQEFQVNTSNYSSEYGRSAGAVVNTVTKSGGNEYHGEAYFYDRNNDWGATNPFTTLTTQTSPGVFATNPYKPTDVRKIYGFGVGGRIIRDKLFFFFAFDRYDRNFPGTAKATNPTAFFAAPSTATIATLATRLGVSPAQATADYNNGLNDLLGELGPVPRKGQQTIFFPKIDWQINGKNHASFEVNRMRWASPAGIQTQASNTFGIASFGNDYVRDTWGVAKLYTFFTSSLSNEARFQYGRDLEFEYAQQPTSYEQANFLVSPNFPGYTNPLGLPPDVFITNGFDMGVPTFLQRPLYPDEHRTQFADTVTWSHGKHTLKFGVDYAHTNDVSQNLRFQYGSFSYSNLLSYFSDLYAVNTCTATGGAHVPCYSSYQQAFGPLGFSFNTNDIAFFAEDSWRVLPKLSLTLGLRYEYEMLPSPILPNPAVPQTASFPSDKNNLGPRVGFAWDIFGDGKTSLRGGYGIYYGRVINSTIYNALTSTGVHGSQFTYFFTPTTAGAPSLPQILSTQPTSTSALSIVYFDPHLQNPSVQQMDLTLEREIGWNTIFSVSYMGSLGRSLPNFVDTNIGPSPASISYTVVDPTGVGPLANGSTYSTAFYGGTRPNASFGTMTDIFSGTSANYNALVVQANKRMSNHVQFNANYTFSHAIDYGQNGSTFSDTNDLLVPRDIKDEKGNSIFDVRHRFVLSMIAESPWKVQGWAGYLLNGWQIAPLYQIQNGLPYSLVTSGTPPSVVSGGVTYRALGSSINGSGGRKGIDIVGRNTFSMPRTQVVDMRISKKFMFKERYAVEVLGEGFNLFNHVNYTGAQNTGYFVSTSNITLPDGTTKTCSNAAPCLNFNWTKSGTSAVPVFASLTNANSNFAYSSRQVQIGVRFTF
jgi:hypothetical protein